MTYPTRTSIRTSTRTGIAIALAGSLLGSGTAQADPALITWIWAQVEGKSHRKFTAAPPVADTWFCHNEVELVSAGGHPDFAIQIRGDCAFLPAGFTPDASGFDPAWVDVTWRGTYDYETGAGSEELKRADGGVIYDVNLVCPPDKNPFIYTSTCTNNFAGGGNSASDASGSPPLSGGRLDGTTRQNLINWENSQGQTQEGEGMDLAPNADAPRILSPSAGGSFPNGVQVKLQPSARGVPLSPIYEVAFYHEKPFSSGTPGTLSRSAVTPGQGISQLQPDLTRSLDTTQNDGVLLVPVSELGRGGHWTLRARMEGTPGAVWTERVPFTAGLSSKTATIVTPGAGLAKQGEKQLGTMKKTGLKELGARVPAVPGRAVNPAAKAGNKSTGDFQWTLKEGNQAIGVGELQQKVQDAENKGIGVGELQPKSTPSRRGLRAR